MIPPRVSPVQILPVQILVVRLGSMGDVIAALPAVASLKHSIPHSKITWVIDPKWSLLLEGNPYVDSVLHLDRRTFTGLRHAWRDLRAARFDFAVDFQGLVKSALVATLARPERIFGFNAEYARESPASWFYSTKVPIRSYHAVERNLDLAAAAGASNILRTFPLPPGEQQANLPDGDFVLASPLAGWGAKQWPLEYYATAGRAAAPRMRDAAGAGCTLPAACARHPGACFHAPGLDLRHAASHGGGWAGQRAVASGGGARQARRRDLWAHRSGAAWSLRRHHRRVALTGSCDHVSQDVGARCKHARDHARSGFRGAGSDPFSRRRPGAHKRSLSRA